MRVKLYNALGEHVRTLAAWEKDFTQWLDEFADAFFAAGGYAEIWNDQEVFRFEPAAKSRSELKQRMKALAA